MSETTKLKLIAAVESLLTEKGFASVTLRDITETAGTNVASVAYHFGSKDDLIAQVYSDGLREVTQAQVERINALPGDASLETVVRTWLNPLLLTSAQSSREAQLWKMIYRGFTEQAPVMAVAMKALGNSVDDSLMLRLQKLIPQVSPQELQLRHDLVLAAVSSVMNTPAPAGKFSQDVMQQALLNWIIGGLTAPALKPELF